jgi:hypothetical protein
MNGARRCAATAGSLLSRRSGKIFHRSDRWTMTRGGRSRRVDSWGFGNIGTESPVKPSSATIAALSELFLVSNRIAQWPQFAPRYGFGHRE